ncbi:metallophosphoesterase [Neobacillus mesonae]|uniref:metallophosphoesterase n=1 Tax=Neobacillus mesonae TaxID=1193713 RepID=UPI00203F1E2C|nr:metallophosphoesterase [Neobacillus mesonae]MCM3568251.1 metallophosphoesterase [Neobacillus mesonae]
MNNLQGEPKRISRRTFLKKSTKLYLGFIAASSMLGGYSYRIERFWYEIKKINLKVKNLPAAFEGWKIVQFSDIHMGFHYDSDEFKPVVKMINDLQPDIIFFTGDLIQAGNMQPDRYIPILQEIKAGRGGKWAVIGNHDMSIKNWVVSALQKSQFEVLENRYDFIEADGMRLYIAGIDDAMYGFPNIAKAVEGIPQNSCVLFLAHEPDIADKSCKYPISAQFSGHSHGGQVRLPYFGSIIKQKMAEKYADGLYHVGDSQMALYVNRGIGTTNLPIRFLCRPEITVFHLKKA